MNCQHKNCGGLTVQLTRILNMQLEVQVHRCLICCREIELTPSGTPHIPVPMPLTQQGRPSGYAGWRAEAKTDMEA